MSLSRIGISSIKFSWPAREIGSAVSFIGCSNLTGAENYVSGAATGICPTYMAWIACAWLLIYYVLKTCCCVTTKLVGAGMIGAAGLYYSMNYACVIPAFICGGYHPMFVVVVGGETNMAEWLMSGIACCFCGDSSFPPPMPVGDFG